MSVKIFCLETLLLSTALIGLASAQGANRQSEGPSKEQTWEYINERVGFNQGEFPDAWRTFSLEGKDRCTMVVRSSSSGIAFTDTVPLKKVAPERVSISVDFVTKHPRVKLLATEDEKAFRQDGIDKNGKPWMGEHVSLGDMHLVPVKNHSTENAEKLVKAFAHLAKLCGGKNDLF